MGVEAGGGVERETDVVVVAANAPAAGKLTGVRPRGAVGQVARTTGRIGPLAAEKIVLQRKTSLANNAVLQISNVSTPAAGISSFGLLG